MFVGRLDAPSEAADADVMSVADSGVPSVADSGVPPAGACGAATFPCPRGTYCSFEGVAACGTGALGSCVAVPSCPDDACAGPEVCGCDGRLHCSECAARAAGFDVAPSEYCDAHDLPRCGSWLGEQCGAGEFCDFAQDLECGEVQPGFCFAVPLDACPPVCNPVCGCDGLRYCNECEAHLAGTDRHRLLSECPE